MPIISCRNVQEEVNAKKRQHFPELSLCVKWDEFTIQTNLPQIVRRCRRCLRTIWGTHPQNGVVLWLGFFSLRRFTHYDVCHHLPTIGTQRFVDSGCVLDNLCPLGCLFPESKQSCISMVLTIRSFALNYYFLFQLIGPWMKLGDNSVSWMFLFQLCDWHVVTSLRFLETTLGVEFSLILLLRCRCLLLNLLIPRTMCSCLVSS